MLRDKTLSKYDSLNQEEFLIRAESFVCANIFDGLKDLISWMVDYIVIKIIDEKQNSTFQELLNSDIRIPSLLERGNSFYTEIFRANGFITNHTRNKENTSVLTSIFKQIHGTINSEASVLDESLIIYRDLKQLIGKKLGETIAKHPQFIEYRYWLAFETMFVHKHYITPKWTDHIPYEILKAELSKFATLDCKLSLKELAANLDISRGDDNYEKFLDSFNKVKVISVFKYLDDVIGINDTWYFNRDIYFRLRLLKKVGLIYWLRMVDQLNFPFLQDHAFGDIDNTVDYADIVELLLDEKSTFLTSKDLLLALTLNNFMEFLQRTSLEFRNYSSGNRHIRTAAKVELIEMAAKDYTEWQERIMPNTFDRILKAIFADGISKSRFFHLFFEWINKYRLENATNLMDQEAIALMKILRPLFQKILNKSPHSCFVLLRDIKPENSNWNSLDMLVDCWDENREQQLLDSIYKRYCELLASKKFSWNTANQFSDETINQAYHFSYLLLGYKDYTVKWETLFQAYMIRYDGWKRNDSAKYEQYRRECFVLLVGIGICYYLYEARELEKVEGFLNKLTEICVSQYRQQPGDSNDYLIPMRFIVCVLAKFRIHELPHLLILFTQKIDDLQVLLLLWEEAILQAGNFSVPNDLQSHIKERIESEFWILEMTLKYPHQRQELQNYQRIKERIISSNNNDAVDELQKLQV